MTPGSVCGTIDSRGEETISGLAKLIWAVVSHFAGGVSAKKLVKLLYFIDLRAAATLGHTITGATYTFHLFGPFPAGFFNARDELLDDYLTLTLLPDLDLDWHLHRVRTTCDLEANYSEGEHEVITTVLQELGRYSAWQLERLSKRTEPMKQASRGDLLGLTAAERQGAAWERAGIPIQRIEREINALRFTDKEQARWAKQEAELVRDLEPLRRRANTACISGELPQQ